MERLTSGGTFCDIAQCSEVPGGRDSARTQSGERCF